MNEFFAWAVRLAVTGLILTLFARSALADITYPSNLNMFDTLQHLLENPESGDSVLFTKGDHLADEAFAAVFGPDGTCDFILLDSDETAMFYSYTDKTLVATTGMMDEFQEDELRALFVWAMTCSDIYQQMLVMILEDLKDYTAITVMIGTMTYAVGYAIADAVENGSSNGGSLDDLIVIGAIAGITVYIVVDIIQIPIRAPGYLRTDIKTMECLAETGYDPDSFVSCLEKIAKNGLKIHSLHDRRTGLGDNLGIRYLVAKMNSSAIE
jgi:hypothetical protein